MPSIVVRSRPIPHSSEEVQDEDLDKGTQTLDETTEFDDSTRDPTWRPVPTIQNRTPNGCDQDRPRDNPRYYLRSRDRQDSQPQASGVPLQAIMSPEGQIDQPQDVSVPDHDTNADNDNDPSFPYSLRPFPGRRNF
jgi:hypothetical protein